MRKAVDKGKENVKTNVKKNRWKKKPHFSQFSGGFQEEKYMGNMRYFSVRKAKRNSYCFLLGFLGYLREKNDAGYAVMLIFKAVHR